MTEEFGRCLRALRKAQHLSQEILAQKAGIGERTVRYWEAGERIPSTQEMESVLNALAIPAHERQRIFEMMPQPRILRLVAALPTAVPLPHPGDLLRAMRARSHKTQVQFAAEMDVTPTTLTRWETLRSFPSEEKLARICLLLKARPEETLVLTSRRLTLPEVSTTTDLDHLREQVKAFIAMLNERSPLADLYALVLIRNLSLQAPASLEARRLLARTLQAQGTLLHIQGKLAEAKVAGKRALSLFAEIQQYDNDWHLTLNLLSCFVGKPDGDELLKAKFLMRHIGSQLPFSVQLGLYSDLAIYFLRGGRQEEAQRMMHQAKKMYCALPEDPRTSHYYTLVYGKFLLLDGRPEAARAYIDAAAQDNPANPYYICNQAKVALALGEKGECERLLQKALALVEGSSVHLMRSRVHLIAQDMEATTRQ